MTKSFTEADAPCEASPGIDQTGEALTYAQHLQIDKILSAQAPLTGQPDEMLFIITHQTTELWMKLLLHELRITIAALRQDALDRAIGLLDRIAIIQRHLADSWDVIATLSPIEFHRFRRSLGKASGMQSHQYRELEFLLGDKRSDYLSMFSNDAVVSARLNEVFRAPSFYDELLGLLARRGLAPPLAPGDRDWSRAHEFSQLVEDAWFTILANPDEYWDLFQLAERTTTLESRLREWQFKHLKTVQRFIGSAAGTGGSTGVDYLAKALGRNFFPELWTARTRLCSR